MAQNGIQCADVLLINHWLTGECSVQRVRLLTWWHIRRVLLHQNLMRSWRYLQAHTRKMKGLTESSLTATSSIPITLCLFIDTFHFYKYSDTVINKQLRFKQFAYDTHFI